MVNQDVRFAAAGKGVRLWQVADALGMLDSNFSRKLRHELSDADKARIMDVIESIAATNQAGDSHEA